MTFIACAALLASAVAFTGCKGDQNAPEKQQEVVKTQFSIAMPNQLSNGARRMPKGSVLKDGLTDFTGMKDITLIPFAKQGHIESSDVRLGNNIANLTDFDGSTLIANSNAKFYEDINIPLSTGSFLFYAQANVDQSDKDKKFSVGSLVPSGLTGQPADIQFNLEPINDPTNAPYSNGLAASASGGKLLAYLNSVAAATDGTKAWYQYTTADNDAMRAMFKTYSELKYLSSFGVARVMSDLYKSLEPLATSNTLAANIRTAINNPEYVDNITANVVTLKSGINNFPGDINLPDGAISIKWDGTSKFVEGDYPNMTDPNKFMFPAALWYFTNSTIQTSNTSKKTMYDGVKDWATILGAHTDAVSVNSKTRAVAIKELIQFAVARLDVTVKLANASLVDNSDLAEGVPDPLHPVTVDCTEGFPVTAVFVGGQQVVDYQFSSKGTGTEYTIYDNVMANTMKATTAASAVNHTLVLASKQNTKVRIAVELKNTIADFYGFENQLIPLNGKFYVVAELDPATITTGDKTDGHVFKQDFTTTANLTLLNLRKAYSTLPDLRTPQLELGFSVDLTWQEGNTYNVNFEN